MRVIEVLDILSRDSGLLLCGRCQGHGQHLGTEDEDEDLVPCVNCHGTGRVQEATVTARVELPHGYRFGDEL